jgi:hypothetical protein
MSSLGVITAAAAPAGAADTAGGATDGLAGTGCGAGDPDGFEPSGAVTGAGWRTTFASGALAAVERGVVGETAVSLVAGASLVPDGRGGAT